MENKLYKGKYVLGIYKKIEIDGTDELVAMFSSVEELAYYLKRSLSSTYAIVSQHRGKKARKDIRISNRTYEFKLVPIM